ncbi:MAG: TonB-dependent receptor plug domain-containing protein, partial [Gammaproteobacteria bacterium]|nr:TonB-dependent receptor plug domain-containing protein [Gammaproteobacteria bacterium]
MKFNASALRAGIVVPAAFSMVAAVPASAAEGTASRRQIEEVVVTAERKESTVQDTSISITAFTEEFLEDFGIRNQEDLQNFIPATTIQPYDATVRGVGRNFRALGGDPGVATYMNGIYSEDLLTATGATFWDVERIEVLRGPQGTLYGRNAVGGAMNILYKEPTEQFEAALKGIIGDYGTQEYYGVVSGPLIEGQLSGRINFSSRENDGVVEEIGRGNDDLDSLGADNVAVQLKWTPIDTVEVNFRINDMDNDRVFGGANGGGLVVLNERGVAQRNTTDLVPGYRFISMTQTDPLQRNYFDPTKPVSQFTNPTTGAIDLAQPLRPGVDHYGGPAAPGGANAPNLNGFQNAAASLTSFNNTSAADAAKYNKCILKGGTEGSDVCAATNGYNWESFEQGGIQSSISWDLSDTVQLKYLYGQNTLSYQRITDDDNTGSLVLDRQFYVNHEADYASHELQAFYEIGDALSFTSGIFFYNAQIDQRGDFYSSVNNARMRDEYQDNTALSAAGAAAAGNPAAEGLSASQFAFAGRPMVNLYTARNICDSATAPASCRTDSGVNTLATSKWYGDNGTNSLLNARHGPKTSATDLLYHTETRRDAFAAYTQGVWDINETFTLTAGVRYAEDTVEAQENLFRYSETGAPGFTALYGGLQAVNIVNGGLVSDGMGGYVPTEKATNGGIPFALSVYRQYDRTDTKWTGRLNLDYNINDKWTAYGRYSALKYKMDNPGMLGELGATVARTRPFPDHHMFTDDDLTALLREADANDLQLVTTEKDFVRLAGPGDLRRTMQERTLRSPEREITLEPGESWELNLQLTSPHQRMQPGVVGRYQLGGRLRARSLLVGETRYSLFVPLLAGRGDRGRGERRGPARGSGQRALP